MQVEAQVPHFHNASCISHFSFDRDVKTQDVPPSYCHVGTRVVSIPPFVPLLIRSITDEGMRAAVLQSETDFQQEVA